MAKRRYSVGDKVDVSRAENGEDHERAVVIDSYELMIGEERRPTVVVEFADGERKYMTATTPNVLPVYEDEEEESDVEAEPGRARSRRTRPTRSRRAKSMHAPPRTARSSSSTTKGEPSP